MGIRPEEVRHVAELARLELRDDEVERAAAELTAVLEYAAALRRLDLGACGVSEPTPAGTPLREDEPAPPALGPGQALAMAPESEGGFFIVPAFVENAEP
jgi:aspartyl-tRNA(Asn)/glutamyl-tRNA(Gln) amidotransferase subunit C